jgi:phosphocarrier protein
MQSKQIEIINQLGLHARAAAKLVALASSFDSEIELEKDGQTVNGKSIMGVMMLAASKGSILILKIEGPDETEAMQQIEVLIEDRFGEEN